MTVYTNLSHMDKLALKLREVLPTDVFTDTEVISLVKGTPDRRYGLMKRAMAEGDIIQLRRGVYSLGKRFQRQPLNLFELAQKVYAPSYISLESALSYHGWIPEAAYVVTSVSLQRSVSFETSVGTFSYTSIPKFNFVAVERIKIGNQIFLMASPAKAIVDYVLVHKLDKQDPRTLMKSLRIEQESFNQISYNLITEIAQTYQSGRAKAFARMLNRSKLL